jgi:type VI secretion system protein ImpC
MGTEAAKAAAPATTAQEAEAPLLSSILATMPETEDLDEQKRRQTYVEAYVKEVIKGKANLVSKEAVDNIKFWIHEIDKKLTDQVNEIMHHQQFQRLEGTWRGLHYLVDKTETGEFLKLRVLNVKKEDLLNDLERAVEFDQSQLFKQVYEAEYGTLGGKPFGMLVGDYEFSQHPQDVALLGLVAQVAACAHAPFVSAASPKMLNLQSYTNLPQPRDLQKIFEGAEYIPWRSFRESEDSRYVALTMPRVLARYPYGEETKPITEFKFEEGVDGKDHSKYLWMNAAWAYAAKVTEAFAIDGWLARTRGVEGGGKVEGLPIATFTTDDGDLAAKCPSEIGITERRSHELDNLGFLPLQWYKDTDSVVFMGAQSCQKPQKYFDPDANTSAELSTKFNYMLCISRFAHYLKVIVRDWVGKYMELADVERELNKWISNYVHPNPHLDGPAGRAKKPLSAAKISVKEVEGRPGYYEAIAHLRPHFQLEGINMSLRMVGKLPASK